VPSVFDVFRLGAVDREEAIAVAATGASASVRRSTTTRSATPM